MRWALKIGRFAGIDVYMHFTFFFLLAWVAFMHWNHAQSMAAVLVGVTFILAIFGCVVLHEYGHALMARRYGIGTRDIILLPIGGVARLEQIPSNPKQELWVALAGPAVNVAIAMALFVWLQLTAAWQPLQSLTVVSGPFLERILAVNLFMIAFNMVPAFPMDGGRVLRALLATRLPYGRATRLAASVGQGFAVVFGIVGLFTNPLLVLIAVFVYLGASQEAGHARMKSALGGVPVQQAMIRDVTTLAATDSVQHAAQLSLTGTQRDFPVVRDGMLEGFLRQGDLVAGLSRGDDQAPVAAVAQQDVITVEADEMLDAVLAKLTTCRCDALPVIREGKLIGMVTADNLRAFMRLQAATAH